MELDDLVLVWKKQDKNISRQLHKETFRHLLKEKSQGVLSKIRNSLVLEFIAIGTIFILFNFLFILVHLPYTTSRWICFIIFNSAAVFCMYNYKKAVFSTFHLKYSEDLRANIERIIKNLASFRNMYRLLNLPLAFLCIITFAGAQNIFLLVPWMVLEYLLWRSILIPRLVLRFESYKAELEYSLKSLEDL